MADSRIFLGAQPLFAIGNKPNNAGIHSQADLPDAPSFADVLHKATGEVSFSKHAKQRLQDRRINFSSQDISKLNGAVARMAEKGAKESLIYMNDVALVVSVKNKTVITAMDSTSAKENIFTNIDSAAIL